MVNSKKGVWLFLVLFLLLIIPFLSAGFFDNFYGKITGKASSSTTTINITIGNSAPTIIYVNSTDPVDPTIGSSTTVTVNFTVRDVDGTGDINLSTTAAYLQRSGESTRSNSTCINLTGAVGNDLNLTCTIKMWYYDQNGAWTINTTATDYSTNYAENSSKTFTYNLQTAMVMNPTALSWTGIGVTSTNTGSTNNPIVVNNSGNDINLNINVTAYDLQGNTTTTDYIFANNFTVDNITAGCSGTAMVNATSTNVTNAYLQRGNNTLNYNNDTSGQEQVYFCLKGLQTNPAISSQGYTSNLFGTWTVAIIT